MFRAYKSKGLLPLKHYREPTHYEPFCKKNIIFSKNTSKFAKKSVILNRIASTRNMRENQQATTKIVYHV